MLEMGLRYGDGVLWHANATNFLKIFLVLELDVSLLLNNTDTSAELENTVRRGCMSAMRVSFFKFNSLHGSSLLSCLPGYRCLLSEPDWSCQNIAKKTVPKSGTAKLQQIGEFHTVGVE